MVALMHPDHPPVRGHQIWNVIEPNPIRDHLALERAGCEALRCRALGVNPVEEADAGRGGLRSAHSQPEVWLSLE